VEPEEIMLVKVAAEDPRFGTPARLTVEPQADDRVRQSMREEVGTGPPRPTYRREAAPDNRLRGG
jgi:hypothetical protein